MDPAEIERIALLPVVARESLEAATASGARGDPSAAWGQMPAAFDAVEFPKYPILPGPVTLSPAQRALAEIVACRRDVPMMNGLAAPSERWVLRRWLGLDPAGVLEREVDFISEGQPRRGPLWLALKTDSSVAQRVDEMNLAERLEAFCEIEVFAYYIRPKWETPSPIKRPDVRALGAEGRAWAPALADELVADARIRKWAPLDLVFLSLVRSRVPFQTRWEALLPVGLAQTDPELFRECLEAIPFERRTAVLAPYLMVQPPRRWTDVFEWAAEIHPQPDLVDALFSNYQAMAERPNAAARSALEQVAVRVPALAPAIARHLSRKKVAKLVFEPVPLPPRDQLTALQKKQLAWFEREGGEWSVLQWFVVRDAKGKHLYDATLHAGDDGKVFRAGTATAVATFAQGGAEARSEGLMAALEQGLEEYERGRKRG